MAARAGARHAAAVFPMADLTTITLAPGELPAYRSAVIACAGPGEHERCERLLGQLASLEAQATAAILQFVPGPSTAPLARRAFDRLDGGRRAG
jgi:hypothetical protein